jgi:hypothetical protein
MALLPSEIDEMLNPLPSGFRASKPVFDREMVYGMDSTDNRYECPTCGERSTFSAHEALDHEEGFQLWLTCDRCNAPAEAAELLNNSTNIEELKNMATAVQYPVVRPGILKLQVGVMETIAFRDPAGTSVQGNYGPQRMYTLIDGRRFYLPEEIAQLIDAKNLKAGETITIAKREPPDGSRKHNWLIERAATPRIPPQPAARMLEHAEALDGTYGAVDQGHPPTLLETALKSAVRATYIAQQYARSIGADIHFSSGDVRALAVTEFIARSQRGGV